MVSPSVEGRVVAERLPLLVRVPRRLQSSPVSLYVDGEPLHIASVLRRRWWSGKEADLIGEIDTSGLSEGVHTLRVVLGEGEVEQWEVHQRFHVGLHRDRLEIQVADSSGVLRNGRVEVFDADGQRVHLGNDDDWLADPSLRDAVRSSLFVVGGVGHLRLTPGQYTLVGSSGIRDSVAEVQVDVPADRMARLVIDRVVQTPGEVTADLHVHTGASGDSFLSDSRRFRSLVAADVEVAVITDHNAVRDFRPAVELLGLTGRLQVIAGAEFRIGPSGGSLGHGNAFPLRLGTELPIPGTHTPAEVVAGWREHGRQNPPTSGVEALIQLNHPRGIQFWPDKHHQRAAHGIFESLGMQPSTPLGQQLDDRLFLSDPLRGERLVDVDALEVLNRFSVEGWRAVRQDWFDLMNQGWFPTGTGNSDSHSSELERPGFPVNLVRAPDGPLGESGLVDSIRGGRVRVSSGPIVSLEVIAGSRRGLPGDVVRGPVTEVWAEVVVQAAPWVPVPEVRLVVDGKVMEQRAIAGATGVERGRWRWRVPVDGDTWMVAEAGWDLESTTRPESGLYAQIAPGHVPIGFTNAVRIDVEGDGVWRPRVDSGLP